MGGGTSSNHHSDTALLNSDILPSCALFISAILPSGLDSTKIEECNGIWIGVCQIYYIIVNSVWIQVGNSNPLIPLSFVYPRFYLIFAIVIWHCCIPPAPPRQQIHLHQEINDFTLDLSKTDGELAVGLNFASQMDVYLMTMRGKCSFWYTFAPSPPSIQLIQCFCLNLPSVDSIEWGFGVCQSPIWQSLVVSWQRWLCS